MFECEKCHTYETEYDYKNHEMICKKCGHIEKIEPKQAVCCHCSQPHIQWTWFHPSGCDKCGKSFVD